MIGRVLGNKQFFIQMINQSDISRYSQHTQQILNKRDKREDDLINFLNSILIYWIIIISIFRCLFSVVFIFLLLLLINHNYLRYFLIRTVSLIVGMFVQTKLLCSCFSLFVKSGIFVVLGLNPDYNKLLHVELLVQSISVLL